MTTTDPRVTTTDADDATAAASPARQPARPLRSLASAMFRGFVRDRMTLFWSMAFPLMFLVLFGGIFVDQGADRTHVVQVGAVALLDNPPAGASAAIDDTLDITKSSDLQDALDQVRSGDKDAVITQDGDTVRVQYSAVDQVLAGRVQGLFGGLVNAANLELSQVPPSITLSTNQLEDDSLEQIQYVTPSLLGWAVAMSAVFGAALNLVMWRKNGLLRRLRLAPISTRSVVLARVGTAMIVAVVQTTVFVGLAVAFFGLKLTGSWPLAIPLLLVGTLAFLSIGLLVGSISRTEEGAAGLANAIVLPMAFLSGSFFPLDGAPAWLQGVSQALPLRHLNDGMLDVMVRGEGPSAVVVPLLILIGFTVVFASIAAKLFRWDA